MHSYAPGPGSSHKRAHHSGREISGCGVVVRAQCLGEHALARRTDEHRIAKRGEAFEVCEQLPALGSGLVEAEPRVEHNAVRCDARRDGTRGTFGERVTHLDHNVAVFGAAMCGIRHPSPVADDHASVVLARKPSDGLEHLIVVQPAGDVVDVVGAGTHRSPRCRGVQGIDRNGDALCAQRLDDRQDAALFFFEGHGRSPRPRRLTADVDDVGPLPHQFARPCDCDLGVEILATIAERVRGDVEHAHDERARWR